MRLFFILLSSFFIAALGGPSLLRVPEEQTIVIEHVTEMKSFPAKEQREPIPIIRPHLIEWNSSLITPERFRLVGLSQCSFVGFRLKDLASFRVSVQESEL